MRPRSPASILAVAALLAAIAARADEAPPTEPPAPDEALVRHLVAALEHDDPDYRKLAAQELRDHPAAAVEHGAAPRLVELALGDPVVEVREEALWALGELGPAARDDALPALWTLADWEAPQPGRVRGIAVWAAARMDPPVDEAARRLVPMTIHHDEFTRAAAADAMGELGEPMLPFLLLALATQRGSGSAAWVVDAIGEIGEPAAPAVPALLEVRADHDSAWVRSSVDRALERIGAPVPAAPEEDRVAQLVGELSGGAGYRKRLAAGGLAELGPAAAPAVPALIAALGDPDVAAEALSALLAIVPEEEWPAVVEAGAPLLADPGWDGRKVALALAGTGAAGEAVLVAGLDDASAAVRTNALLGLGERPASSAAYRPIRRLLGDADPEVRRAAADALARYGERAVPALDRAIRRERDPGVEAGMVRALGTAGPRAIPSIRGALQDDRVAIREAAAGAAGELGAAGLELVPDLLAAAGRDGVLSEALTAVERLGPGTAPDLVAALATHEHGAVRADAALALARVGAAPELAVPALARALDDPEEDVRQWAAFGLGQMGPAAAPAVEDLRAALTDPEPWVRQNAAWALGEIGAPAHGAIPDLVAVVEHDRSTFPAEKAAEALGSFGPAAEEAVGPLARALDDDGNEYLRAAAARALIRIGVASPVVQEQLRGCLDDPRARVRWAAGDALLVLGEPDDVVAALVVVRKAPDEAWDEDLEAMERFHEMLEPIPAPEEPPTGE